MEFTTCSFCVRWAMVVQQSRLITIILMNFFMIFGLIVCLVI